MWFTVQRETKQNRNKIFRKMQQPQKQNIKNNNRTNRTRKSERKNKIERKWCVTWQFISRVRVCTVQTPVKVFIYNSTRTTFSEMSFKLGFYVVLIDNINTHTVAGFIQKCSTTKKTNEKNGRTFFDVFLQQI